MTLRRLLACVLYPTAMLAAFACHRLAAVNGAPPLAAAWGAVALVAIGLALLQSVLPWRAGWRAASGESRTDFAYLLVVQLALPLAMTQAGAQLLHRDASPWPSDWPYLAQVALVLLIADCLRYWIHRTAHGNALLGFLHDVHHSPRRLYALNAARFHPLEKMLHWCADSLPFLILGVSPEVLAGYFVVYAVNGLFQHCNLRVVYGPLAFVVAGADAHRWHHARDGRLSYCNFGSTLLIWDRIFGTLRETRRPYARVGLVGRIFPEGFVAQLAVPFADLRRWLEARLIGLGFALVRLRSAWRIRRTAADPAGAQRRVLAAILRANGETAFGRAHGFAAIADAAAFAAAVPVRDYEALRPWVERGMAGGGVLTAAPPVAYARTSGSTGLPKDVPLTREYLDELRRIHAAALAHQMRRCPRALDGGILALNAPATEGHLANGLPFGAASGLVAQATPGLLRRRFVLPAEALAIAEGTLKYLAILRIALARPDITTIATANPATLLALVETFLAHRDALLRDLRAGGFFRLAALEPSLIPGLLPHFGAAPEHATRIAALGPAPRLADLWPNLQLLATWTRGGAGIALAALRRGLPAQARVADLGYIASEFRATLVLGRRAGGWPALDSHFFEFVERDLWEAGTPRYLLLDQLRRGVDYYVVVTTPSGLYRYFINDLVRVTGFLRRTPLLEFVQKGRGVTSIGGEKLYEGQAIAALHATMAEFRLAPRFAVLLADEAERSYRLYLEADAAGRPGAAELAAHVDAQLQAINLEYRCKRAGNRVKPLLARWLLPGSGEAYKRQCVAAGQREAQFKARVLATVREIGFDFSACTEAGS